MKPTLLLLASALLLPVLAPAAERPNVVVMMADDMGFECVSSNGSEMYETPNIDALGASGMRFLNAHSQPICTPSRVQIMTGIYNNRNYVKFGLLHRSQTTFGNVMRDAGYATAVVGKWQLSGGYEAVDGFGFDRHCLWQLTRRPSRYPNPGLEIDGEEQDFKNGEFGPHVCTEYIDGWLGERAEEPDEPFFLYYPMICPHWPFVPTPGSEDWDPEMWRDEKGEPGGYKDQKYWDIMVTLTDDMVGRVVASLEKHQLRDNTLVVFTCDNGTYTGVKSEFNGADYAGGKGSPFHPGTHVPFVASWPGVIGPDQVREELVDFSDIMPTVAELGETDPPEGIDGTSLIPLFRGEERDKPYIYCWYSRDGNREAASQSVRDARYKLYADGRFFDIEEDIREKSPLTEIPEELRGTHAALEAYLAPHLEATAAADDPINELRKTSQRD